MVYYRKYRPQSLDELIGQDHVKLTLQRAFENKKIAHAYLFCGPKGTGKTSTARILAKMVNCTQTNPPCNKCSSCLSITDGSFMDLIEIDAASNRGIDDIRDLREKIKLSPTTGKKKVYIIDEVHMLSNEAFNALLKTLEEPPEHVLFILATTELHKIPATILSRVQKLDFKTATPEQLKKTLEKIIAEEKLKVDDGVMDALIKSADGSFRDAIKLLDQLASSKEKITIKNIEDELRVSSFENLMKLLESIVKKDATLALRLVLEQVELGVNIKEFNLSFLDLLHSLILIKYNLGNTVEEESPDKYAKLESLSKEVSLEDLLVAFENFQDSLEKIRFASIPSFPLEIAIIESCLEKKEKRQEKVIISKISQVPEREIIISAPANSIISDSAGILVLKDKWNYILETVRPYNYSLEAMLKLAKIAECSDTTVVLEVPYSFHQRIIEAPRSRDLLESVLQEVLGKPVKVSTVLGQKPLKVEELANVEVAQDDEMIKLAAEIFNS